MLKLNTFSEGQDRLRLCNHWYYHGRYLQIAYISKEISLKRKKTITLRLWMLSNSSVDVEVCLV